MNAKVRDMSCGVMFLLVGVFMYWGIRKVPNIIENEVGSAFVPRLVAIALMCLAGLLIVLSILKNKRSVDTQYEGDVRGGILTMAILGAYVLLFNRLGFILATFLYLFLQITILSDSRNRNLRLFAVIAAVVSITVYSLFVKAFGLILPPGVLGWLLF